MTDIELTRELIATKLRVAAGCLTIAARGIELNLLETARIEYVMAQRASDEAAALWEEMNHS